MEKKMEIAKIVIQMGKKEVPLSVDEAKKLFKLLEEMFGEKVIERHHHHDYWNYRPYWGWSTPTYCSSNSGELTYNSNDNSVLCSVS